MAIAVLAQDRDSVRDKDKDGRLHVEVSNISKANVCPYVGREIPGYRELGLDPDKIYQLLRDPEELKRAAPTFNGLPILSEHLPTSATDHPKELVIGSTGSEAAYNHPYLQNRLSFWPNDAIQDIESERKKELSSAYHYRADMTPGTYEGQPYDGVMRDIVGNHVASVKNGRAGADVVVGDSNEAVSHLVQMSKAQHPQPSPLRRFNMTKALLTRKAVLVQGACMAALTPMLALDAKIDFAMPFKGVTAKNYASKKPAILTALKAATEGKLAQDADMDDLVELLDKLDGVDPAEDDANSAIPVEAIKKPDAVDADPLEKIKAFLKGKISDEDLAQLDAVMAGQAADDDTNTDDVTLDDAIDPKDMVSKPAMDAAIAAAVKAATRAGAEQATRNQREIRDAERMVHPYVGDLAIACDSAESVYRHTLKALGVDVAGVHASALPTILKLQPLPGSTPKAKTALAQDAAASKSFAERFPGAARIQTL